MQSSRSLRLTLAVLLLLICTGVNVVSDGQDQFNGQTDVQGPLRLLPSDASRAETKAGSLDNVEREGFGAEEIAAANTAFQSLNVADWLGPLAPVALSPFFAMACLSGLSIWGPEWLSGNVLLASATPLKSQLVFAVFAVLAVLTSLPRFTKVSKPFAQAIDQVETYSVLVILLVVKLFAGIGEDSSPQAVAMIQFGVVSFTAQSLLAIAMVVNLLVINSVKFFFEFLIWLTPIPAVDAMFEIANKSVCAGLMALYAFSPTVATVINLLMLFAALIVFRWIHRRLTFYRSMLVDLLLPKVWKSYGRPTAPRAVGFVKSGPPPFMSKSRWNLQRNDDKWIASQSGWFGVDRQTLDVVGNPTLCRGWIKHTVLFKVSNGEVVEFHLSRRFDGAMNQFVKLCDFACDESIEINPGDAKTQRAEFA